MNDDIYIGVSEGRPYVLEHEGDHDDDTQLYRLSVIGGDRLAVERIAGEDRPTDIGPATFLFDFDDPFEDGGMYVWIVAEPFYRETGYLDDSSSASSVVTEAERNADDADEEDLDRRIEEAHRWLNRVTDGILCGEGMESCWETLWQSEESKAMNERLGLKHRPGPYDGMTREQAQERIRVELEARGFKHEDMKGDEA
jgi:hypothetical protein